MSVHFRIEHPNDDTHFDEQTHLSDHLEAIVMLAIAIVMVVGFLVHY